MWVRRVARQPKDSIDPAWFLPSRGPDRVPGPVVPLLAESGWGQGIALPPGTTGAVELKEIGAEDLGPVAELNRAIWYPDADPGHFMDFYRSLLATTWSQAHVRVMGLMQGSELLSSFKLSTLDFRIAGKSYRAAGIGNLMTFPTYRGRGHATHMLKAALAALRNSYHIAMLFSSINPLFYARLGFAEIPTQLYEYDTTRSAVQLAGPAALDEALIRTALDIDLDDVIPLYADVMPALPIALHRDVWFWRHRLELARLRERSLGRPRDAYRLVVYGEPGNVDAYMWLSCRPQRWDVEEIAGRRGESVGQLLEWALREARASGVPRLACQVRGRARPCWGKPMATAQGEPALMIHPLASSIDLDAMDRPECNLIWKTERF